MMSSFVQHEEGAGFLDRRLATVPCAPRGFVGSRISYVAGRYMNLPLRT